MKHLTLPLLSVLFFLYSSCSTNDNPPPPPADSKLELTSFTPGHGMIEDTITLRGKNFSTNINGNHVSFTGGLPNAEVLTATATELTLKVPSSAVTGKITIRVGSQTAVSVNDFIVDPETSRITDFNPKQGPIGTTVTITGRKFGNTVAVSLNGIQATITRKNETEIVFTIPNNTTLTSHKIDVQTDGANLQTAGNFTVTSTGPAAQWIQKNFPSFPTAFFQFGISFVYKNKIYWGFTKLSFNQAQADYMVFDPSAPTPQWVLGVTPPVDMAPAQLQSAVAIVHNNKVYIGTGLGPDRLNKWWEYNPETNSSKALTDYPEATSKALSFVVKDSIFVGFGGSNTNLYKFIPTANNGLGSWELAAATTIRELSGASTFVIGNEAYIGRALLTAGGARNNFFRFTGTNSLTQVAAIPEDILSANTPSFVIGNKGYFITDTKVWEYTPSPAGGNWRIVISTATAPAIKHTAVVTINNLPVVYGWTGNGEIYEFKIQ